MAVLLIASWSLYMATQFLTSPWSIKFSQIFCVCFIVFLYMSAGCVSTFRTCVQGYLEWLPFIFCFLLYFLSIRKVIIFSAIATDDRHPLRSRSIHQNAANCMTICFRYIAQPRGVRKTYCARSRNDVRRLTSRSNGMPSKKIMESLRTFVFVETVLRRSRMFQGSDGV